MITNEHIAEVMKERNLPYSKAKMLLEMLEREAKIEGAADYVYGQDEGGDPAGFRNNE